MNVEQPSRVGRSLLPGVDKVDDLLLLSSGQFGPTSTDAPFLTSSEQPTARALAQHGALELGEGAHHLHCVFHPIPDAVRL